MRALPICERLSSTLASQHWGLSCASWPQQSQSSSAASSDRSATATYYSFYPNPLEKICCYCLSCEGSGMLASALGLPVNRQRSRGESAGAGAAGISSAAPKDGNMQEQLAEPSSRLALPEFNAAEKDMGRRLHAQAIPSMACTHAACTLEISFRNPHLGQQSECCPATPSRRQEVAEAAGVQVLDGLRWCGRALLRDRQTRIVDSCLPKLSSEASSAGGPPSLTAVAQRAQHGAYPGLPAFQAAFASAAQALLQSRAVGRQPNSRCCPARMFHLVMEEGTISFNIVDTRDVLGNDAGVRMPLRRCVRWRTWSATGATASAWHSSCMTHTTRSCLRAKGNVNGYDRCAHGSHGSCMSHWDDA